MKYRVRSSFRDAKTTYPTGELLTEGKVKHWKNLAALVTAGFLEILLEVDDNVTNTKS